MENELKPCPFCGGEPSIYKENGEVFIACTKCQCGTAYLNGASPIEEKIKVAVQDWNRRV